MSKNLPRRIVVNKICSSRYEPGTRPLSWDLRSPGVEEIETSEGEKLLLFSNGGQSSPGVGWELLLTGNPTVDDISGVGGINHQSEELACWTLFGIRPPA